MFLSVQQAARRLGVSPVTIRRWTATGFLPCTRTAGGHRRIDEHDIDDLARAIGNSNHLAAQLAREREVDVLINTSIALASKLDLTELLLEIAMRMTSLLDCHFCAISEYDREADAVRHPGRVRPRRPAPSRRQPLPAQRLPAHARACSTSRSPRWSTSTAPTPTRPRSPNCAARATAACSWCRSSYRGSTIGLLEVIDQRRSRDYSRQELRLAGAIAGQAAVAIQNAKLFAERRRSDEDIATLREALGKLTEHVPEVGDGRPQERHPRGRRRTRSATPSAPSRAWRAWAARAPAPSAPARSPPTTAGHDRGTSASLVVARDPSGRTDLTLAVTLAAAARRGPGRAARPHRRRRRAALTVR